MTAVPSTLRSDTLSPLPEVLRTGLIAVSFFGLLSLTASSILFLFLTYRLISWYYRGQLRNGANQFVILIYNLLLADIQQAIAFSLTVTYVASDKIEVGTTTCWANGWFVSTGDLASGVFIFSIAVHTFVAVIKGRSVSGRVFYTWIALAWVFVYLMAVVGVGVDPKLYKRAGAWCWIDHKYDKERLWLHYFWIFLCMFGTVVIYSLIFLSLSSRSKTSAQSSLGSSHSDPAVVKRAAKYMVIFPVAYVICTLPLAGGRMAAMTGMSIPYWWYCLSGAAITSCGWIDVCLYVMTRRVLIFSRRPPLRDDFGLDTLGWKLGTNGWQGTTTIIEGPASYGRKRKPERDILGRRTPRSLRERHSDEDYFAAAQEGVISTKTTVEVTHGPMLYPYATSDMSIVEMDDKPGHTRTPASESRSDEGR